MSIFDSVSMRRPKSAKHNLSHERKLSCQMGSLVPVMIQEILPGDKFTVSAEILMRFAPMLAPIMHRVNVKTEYFFVPNRIVWDNWEDFITGGTDGLQLPPLPTLTMDNTTKANFVKGSLADYFGLPVTKVSDTIVNPAEVTALPFRAYQLIYNEYYRDQTLQTEVPFSKGDSTAGDTTELAFMRTRAWEKDYFTSALPFAQRGGDVSVPGEPNYSVQGEVVDTAGNPKLNAGIGQSNATGQFQDDLSAGINIHNLDDVGISITDLRRASRLQEFLEKSARGGARYIEQILSHFGVISSDSRLQRPEFLGGGKQSVMISEVLNTAGTIDPDNDPTFMQPVGEYAGHGVSTGSHHGFKKRFEEHGYVIGIMSVMPRTAYQQGIAKMWQKPDKFDYFWPEFSNIGEQTIVNNELIHDWLGATGVGGQTFGYQSRYAEYKFQNSSVHGDMRDNLDFWHMGQIYDPASPPALNSDFVKSNPTQRIFAVDDPTIDKLYCQIYNRITAIRPIPYMTDPHL